ncbi:MAG TPA: SMC family ATPase [Clostridiales bacterium]|nr:SMC family ATPase [Clostridiales bacterium]
MKPVKLEINAFGPFCKRTLIPFGEFGESGLFLLTGDTGAGKTTIFDAISFALFGNASGENRTPDCFRSDYATPEEKTFVELVFLHKGKSYQVTRNPAYERSKRRSSGITMEKSDATLVMPDGSVIAGSSRVTSAIVDLLGIDWRQYKQIAMIAQGEFLQLLTADSNERGIIFRKVFGTQIFDDIQKKLKVMSNNLRYRCEDLDKSILQFLNGISCEGEDSPSMAIKEWKASPDINRVDKILEQLAAMIDRDTLLYGQEQAAAHILSGKIKEKTAEYTAAQGINQAFLELQRAEGQYQALLAREADMEQLEALTQRGRKALYTVKPAEEAFLRTTAELQKLNAAIAQQHREEERLTKELSGCKRALAEKEAARPEIDVLNLKIKRQEEDGVKYDAALELELSYKKADQEKKRLEQELGELEVQSRRLMAEQEEKVKEQEAFSCVDRDLVAYSNQLEQTQRAIEKFKEILVQYGELLSEKAQLEQLQVRFTEAQLQYLDQSDRYLKLETQFLSEQAGIMAAKLEEGKPCPVCGSEEHPRKAQLTGEAPSEEQLKQAGARKEQLQKEMAEASSNCRTQLTKLELKQSQLKKEASEALKQGRLQKEVTEAPKLEVAATKEADTSLEVDTFPEATVFLEQIHDQVKDKLEAEEASERELRGKVLNVQEKLKQKEQCIARLQDIRRELEQKEKLIRGKTEEKAALMNRLSMLEGQLTALRSGLLYPTKKEAERALEADRESCSRLQKELAQAEEGFRSCESALGKLKAVLAETQASQREKAVELAGAEENLAQKLRACGFAGMEEYKESFLPEEELERRQETLGSYQRQRSSLEQDLKRLSLETRGKESKELAILEKEQAELDREKQESEARQREIFGRLKINKEILKNARETYQEQEGLRKEFLMVNELSRTANGELAGKAKIAFEQYVQAFYFNSIINEANKRLYKMTNSQYALRRKEDPTDLRSSAGLELEVMDYYTGKPRSIKSLSGGESFKAALSLALGLSDVIQGFAGGIQVDTMFIDEGFGSLDSNSLEQAIETLNTLTTGNRLVGIISHVGELKERIDKKIVITKRPDGSSLTLLK